MLKGCSAPAKTRAVFKTPCLPHMAMMPKAPTITGKPIGTAISRMIHIRPGKSRRRASAKATGRPRTMDKKVESVA